MKQLNYLRKAEKFLKSNLIPWLDDHHPEDAKVCEGFVEDANSAVKFVLPDGGRIFDSGLKGISGLPALNLPFDSVLIEYAAIQGAEGAVEHVVGKDNSTPYPRRIVLANQQDEFIFVYSVVGSTTEGVDGWAMQPMCVVLHKVSDHIVAEPSIKSLNETTVKGVGSKIVPTGTLFDTYYKNGREEWAWADMSDEVLAVLELIEALSCSNVTHEAMPKQKQNKASIRRGEKSFDEYRMLVVKQTSKGSEDGGGSHASPREHLRRGHIRSLQNGKRIWINSCVVNAGIGGRIHKGYDMRNFS